jgi:hypothetical protein
VECLGAGATKIAAHVWMGDIDQRLGALSQSEAEQIDVSVFRDNPVNVPASRHPVSVTVRSG